MFNEINEEQLKRVREVSNMSGLSIEQLLQYIIKLKELNSWTMADEDNSLQRLSELWNESIQDISKPNIEQLKKQIKYSKNPLEVKMLNRQLNQMYKDKKGVGKN